MKKILATRSNKTQKGQVYLKLSAHGEIQVKNNQSINGKNARLMSIFS